MGEEERDRVGKKGPFLPSFLLTGMERAIGR